MPCSLHAAVQCNAAQHASCASKAVQQEGAFLRSMCCCCAGLQLSDDLSLDMHDPSEAEQVSTPAGPVPHTASSNDMSLQVSHATPKHHVVRHRSGCGKLWPQLDHLSLISPSSLT